MKLTREQAEKIKIVRLTGDNHKITILDQAGHIIKLNVNPDGTLEIENENDYREGYWRIRTRLGIKADEFAEISCVSLPTLRKWEHGEQVTKMTEEKIKATVGRLLENGK